MKKTFKLKRENDKTDTPQRLSLTENEQFFTDEETTELQKYRLTFEMKKREK